MDSLLIYLVKSGCCLGLFYIVFWVFLQKETHFRLNRWYLILSLILSFILPLIPLESPIRQVSISDGISGTVNTEITQRTVNIFDFFGVAFLLGAGFYLIRALVQWISLARMIAGKSRTRFAGCQLIETDNARVPFSFFYYIFIPSQGHLKSCFQQMLEHEMVHVRQWHTLDNILLELLVIIQWWNPFVWPYRRSLKETHEFLADFGVIAQGCDSVSYQMLILEQVVGDGLFAIANSFHQSQIKRRIAMLTKRRSRNMTKAKALVVVPIVLLLGLAFARPKTVIIPTQTKQTKSVEQDKKKEELKKQQAQMTKEDLKKTYEKITIQMQELKKKYKATESEDDRKKIKEKLAVLAKKRESIKVFAAEKVAVVKKEKKVEKM